MYFLLNFSTVPLRHYLNTATNYDHTLYICAYLLLCSIVVYYSVMYIANMYFIYVWSLCLTAPQRCSGADDTLDAPSNADAASMIQHIYAALQLSRSFGLYEYTHDS